MKPIIGIDLGGTNIRGGVVNENRLSGILQQRITSQGSAEEVLHQLFQLTDALAGEPAAAIGIGVPGLVDVQTGTVYDVVNIPSWKELPLQKLMEERYQAPQWLPAYSFLLMMMPEPRPVPMVSPTML